MNYFLPIIWVLYIFPSDHGQKRSSRRLELSYQELKHLNVSCPPQDTCSVFRETDYPVVSDVGFKCSCHNQCWEFGTCCIDSPYRHKPAIQKCRNVGVTLRHEGYYMIDRCSYKTHTDSIWKIYCEKENEDDNLLLFTPVTSLNTFLTYRNYYCFKCHETTENYVSWDLLVASTADVSGMNVDGVFYDQEQKTWMANYDENDMSVPANLSFKYPDNLVVKPFSCNIDIISDCPDTWTEKSVREKCLAYTAVVSNLAKSYKNVHCALCNNVALDNVACIDLSVYIGHYDLSKSLMKAGKGDKVGNAKKCDKNYVWDPNVKKCRKLSCNIPGRVIKKRHMQQTLIFRVS